MNEVNALKNLLLKLCEKLGIDPSDKGETPPTLLKAKPLDWPTDQGPSNGPHPWSRKIAKTMKPCVAMDEVQKSAMMFEAARGVLTYREIESLFLNTYTAAYINLLARKSGIARHQNPKIHKGKRFRTRFAA